MSKSATTAVTATLTAFAATLVFMIGMAYAAVAKGDYAGKTEAEIATTLEQQGYEVQQIAAAEGMLEALAFLNGEKFEIVVDPQSGTVVEITEGQ